MQVGTSKDFKYLATKIQAVNEKILKLISREEQIASELDLERLEIEVQALSKELGDLIVAQKVHVLFMRMRFTA